MSDIEKKVDRPTHVENVNEKDVYSINSGETQGASCRNSLIAYLSDVFDSDVPRGIDAEVADFFGDKNAPRIVMSEEENVRVRWLVHKRVLTVLVITYFAQALDKGCVPRLLFFAFHGCYHLRTTSHAHVPQDYKLCQHYGITRGHGLEGTRVCVAHHLRLHRHLGLGVPHQSPHSTVTHRQIPLLQHHCLGRCTRWNSALQELHWLDHRPNAFGSL